MKKYFIASLIILTSCTGNTLSFESDSGNLSVEANKNSETISNISYISISQEQTPVSVTSFDETSEKETIYNIPSNTPFTLDSWENFAFSDGNTSFYNEYFNYYYGTSIKPMGCVRGDEYGIDLNYNTQGLVSPLFASWEKIEINIDLYFIKRTSNKYKPKDNEPSFILVQYDSDGNKIKSDDININSSQVNTNNSKYTLKIDVYNNKMNYFDLKYNNSISKSSNYFTYAISQISLKGWPYGM